MAESIVHCQFVATGVITWDHSALLHRSRARLEWISTVIDQNEFEIVLRNAGSSWSAAQAHGLLCSRLAVMGEEGGADWLGHVLQDADSTNDTHSECLMLMDDMFEETYRQLNERQSEFSPLLPDDTEPSATVTAALAEWCVGFLHGLVSDVKADDLKQKLAAEPLSDIIKDMLEMTRASVDDDVNEDINDEALMELIEYLRIAAQLVFEELAELRHPVHGAMPLPESDALH